MIYFIQGTRTSISTSLTAFIIVNITEFSRFKIIIIPPIVTINVLIKTFISILVIHHIRRILILNIIEVSVVRIIFIRKFIVFMSIISIVFGSEIICTTFVTTEFIVVIAVIIVI